MAKNKGKKNMSAVSPGCHGATLREENVGKKHVSASSMLRMQHLQKLAVWAGGEASIPPLGALFGHHLAANAEAMGIHLDRSLFPCQRCETVLQPGYNCTIRIEKNASKARRHRKACTPSQNNVVFTCHFCSHRNLKRGTPKGHIRELLASRTRPVSKSNSLGSTDKKRGKYKKDMTARGEIHDHEHVCLPFNPKLVLGLKSSSPEKEVTTRDIPAKDSLMTPSEKININLSVKKRKTTGSGSSKVAASGPRSETTESGKDSGASGKRRRKGWSSLKEIAESNEREKTCSIRNLAIPFLM